MKLIRFFIIPFIFTFFTLANICQAQIKSTTELQKKLQDLKQHPDYQSDIVYLNNINLLASKYADGNPDSALLLLKDQVENYHKAGYKRGEVNAYNYIGIAFLTKGDFIHGLSNYEQAYNLAKKYELKKSFPSILENIAIAYMNQGNYIEVLEKYYEVLELAQAAKDNPLLGATINNIATIHFYQGKMKEADSAYRITLQIALELKNSIRITYAYNNIGEVELEQNQTDSALSNFDKAYKIAVIKNTPDMLVVIINNFGNTYLKKDSFPQAVTQFEKALKLAKENDYGEAICKAFIGLAKAKNKQGLFDDALKNGLDALQKAQQMGQTQLIRDANELVAETYEKKGNGMEALLHYKAYMVYADSLNNIATERAAANEGANYKIAQNKIHFEKKSLQLNWIIFSALAALFTVCVILWIINRNKKRLNKTYKDLQIKKELIEKQKQEAEITLVKLKETQKQLIQSEKMASLGELTAGIAHEIQNPLNFVNNFSELNKEMLEELKIERLKSNSERDEALQDELINEVIGNSEKINHHGKRAGNIVKGMLQHSRTNTGEKEPTDINALTDEYLHLTYHKLRTKDKNFNAKLETNYDNSIGKINIVSEDIRRVILNLITNAFYACTECSRSAVDSYQSTVSVSTKKNKDNVEIIITDNGNGIPLNILDKIFQPFFTTKPAGSGTGLGLSLSYDIVNTHGGTIKVESKSEKGTTFIIQLPN